jgi:hypothetical protein
LSKHYCRANEVRVRVLTPLDHTAIPDQIASDVKFWKSE